jgi:hypothetical protein
MESIYEYGFEAGADFLIFHLIYMLFVSLFGIAAYVLRSLGVYTIAQRRGIKRSWFAWMPVLDQYLLGCVSDQYQYVVKGKNKNKRTVLLWLNIGRALIGVGFGAAYVWLLANWVQIIFNGVSAEMWVQSMMSPMMTMLALTIPMLALSLVTVVFRYIALYDLYTSCSPQNNAMFLALSIIFKVTEPFFIFFNRKKDDGMPPRKADIIPEPVAEISAPEIDPWDRPDNV